MMKDTILKILSDADDDVQCEWPSHFNLKRETHRVLSIKPSLEDILGSILDLNSSIQDASYFASLSLWKFVPPDPNLYTAPGVKRGGMNIAVIDISFSCFGNLVTISSSVKPKERFSDEKINRVAKALNEKRFVYIPEKYLLEKYSGRNPYFAHSTWGERYFSVL